MASPEAEKVDAPVITAVSLVLPSISSSTLSTASSSSSSPIGQLDEVRSPTAVAKPTPKPLPLAPRAKETSQQQEVQFQPSQESERTVEVDREVSRPPEQPPAPATPVSVVHLAPEVEERVKTQRRLTNEWLSAPGTPPKPDLHPDVLKAMESLSKRSPRGALPALELADRDLGDIDVVALGPVSRFVPSLDLRSNRIGQRGCLAIASAATHAGSHLQRVTLKGNLGIKDEGVAVFAEALRDKSCSLTALGLGEVAMTVAGLMALAEALKVNTRLESLDLRNNAIGAEGVEVITRVLKTSNSSLKTLFLIRNGILDNQDRAAGCIADLLSSASCALTHLTFDDNLLQPAGMVLIANALRSNSTLKYLSLRDNFINIEAAEVLKGCLKDNVSLYELDLRGNKGIRGSLFAPLDTNCPKLEKLWADPK